jgi:hypothetical protein
MSVCDWWFSMGRLRRLDSKTHRRVCGHFLASPSVRSTCGEPVSLVIAEGVDVDSGRCLRNRPGGFPRFRKNSETLMATWRLASKKQEPRIGSCFSNVRQ